MWQYLDRRSPCHVRSKHDYGFEIPLLWVFRDPRTGILTDFIQAAMMGSSGLLALTILASFEQVLQGVSVL